MSEGREYSSNMEKIASTPNEAGQIPQGPQKLHITEVPTTIYNWHKKLNWLGIILTVLIPLYGMIEALRTPLRYETAIWSIIYYFCTGTGITAGKTNPLGRVNVTELTLELGYHRLWSHRSYNASMPLKVYLALVGAGAGEGSVRWWAKNHRAHHRHTDTDKDPYSVNKGLAYSHMGWLVNKQNPKRIGQTEITDLRNDTVVMWQHQNYVIIMLCMVLLLPTAVSGIGWNDWKGGFVYAGILRMFFVHQATFCVNSLAHWLGDQPYEDRDSPRDHLITALLALGEGYHNFHHEFPSDYRNAFRWFQYDPTKWLIWTWCQLGLASDLKRFPSDEIQKCQILQQQKHLDQEKEKHDWGRPISELPAIEWDEYIQAKSQGRLLVVVAGVAHDVTQFIDEHPGGRQLLASGIGKDATEMFYGGVYNHSRAAHIRLEELRVAVIRGGCEVEVRKKVHSDQVL
ncbi:acyl-CoA desaturase [Penicillium herquei]|nr:acyl-CoA desaturase [Penicillium herquei]